MEGLNLLFFFCRLRLLPLYFGDKWKIVQYYVVFAVLYKRKCLYFSSLKNKKNLNFLLSEKYFMLFYNLL